MKSRTMKSIIDELLKSGVDIRYRKRSDGGYLITSIEGEKFTGAKGNARAREMTGEFISQKRKIQLESIKPPKLEKFDKETKKLIQQTQRIWKKNKRKKDGRITTKRFRKRVAAVGLEEAKRSLKETQRYAKGIAYSENVTWLIERLSNPAYAPAFDGIIAWIKRHSEKIKEDYIQEINEVMYDLDEGIITLEMAVVSIRNILGIKTYVTPSMEVHYAS